jgi:hypothetical protein
MTSYPRKTAHKAACLTSQWFPQFVHAIITVAAWHSICLPSLLKYQLLNGLNEAKLDSGLQTI